MFVHARIEIDRSFLTVFYLKSDRSTLLKNDRSLMISKKNRSCSTLASEDRNRYKTVRNQSIGKWNQ
jgi:hypothetical protein